MRFRHRVPPTLALIAFRELVRAINAGQFREASGPIRRLRDYGLLISWQPGKAKASHRASEEEVPPC